MPESSPETIARAIELAASRGVLLECKTVSGFFPGGGVVQTICRVPPSDEWVFSPDLIVREGGLEIFLADLRRMQTQGVIEPVTILPPQSTSLTTKSGVLQTTTDQGVPTQVKGSVVAPVSLDQQIQALALNSTGRNEQSWDQWNWFYTQIKGESGPAPEDRGIARAADSSVLIDGKASYPYDVWRASAFGGAPVPLGDEIAPPVRETTTVPELSGLLDLLKNMLETILRLVASGAGRSGP